MVKTTAVSPTPEASELSLRDLALITAMAIANTKDAKEKEQAVRNLFQEKFAALHAETGSKKVDVLTPDGQKVSTATMSDSKDSTDLVDEAAFLEWVMAHPEWDTEIETVVRVVPAFQAALLKKIVWPIVEESTGTTPVLDDDGKPVLDEAGNPVLEHVMRPVLDDDGEPVRQAMHRETGELVPGLRLVKGRTKTESSTFRWEKPKAGAAAVEGLERDGAAVLAEFMATHPLSSMIPAELDAPTVDGK